MRIKHLNSLEIMRKILRPRSQFCGILIGVYKAHDLIKIQFIFVNSIGFREIRNLEDIPGACSIFSWKHMLTKRLVYFYLRDIPFFIIWGCESLL